MADLFVAWKIFFCLGDFQPWLNFDGQFQFQICPTCLVPLKSKFLFIYFQLITSSQVMFCCSKTHRFTKLSFAMCDNWQSMALQSCVPSPRT
jgi:hypothetical protein